MTLRNWIDLLRAAAQRQEGQTMAEYGVVLAVITVGIIVALGALALAISGKLNAVSNILKKHTSREFVRALVHRREPERDLKTTRRKTPQMTLRNWFDFFK